jgi:hypothetical protein
MFDWFKSRFSHDADHYLYVPIPAQRVRLSSGEKAPDTVAVAGEHYFRIWLVQMFLKKDRDWFSAWHPAVHASVELQFGGSSETLTSLAGASRLKDVDASHLERVVSLNHPLTALLPFNGGSVALAAGLLAMQGKSDVKEFIKVVSSFSGLLAVPELSRVLSVAGPLADGVSSLVGATNGQLVLGLNQTFTGGGGTAEAVLRAGYVAVVAATRQELDPGRLSVREDQLYLDDGPLTGRHYLLFRIECRDGRDDWDSLSSIQEPYAQAIELLRLNQVTEAETSLRAAVAAAYKAKELTKIVDRRRVVTQLKARFEEAKTDLGARAIARGGSTASLAAVMADGMSVDQARVLPPITAREALGVE